MNASLVINAVIAVACACCVPICWPKNRATAYWNLAFAAINAGFVIGKVLA